MQQLSPTAKQPVFRVLVAQIDELDALVDYGSQRMRALCGQRGLDWDSLSEEDRQRLIDQLLHEA